MQKKILEAIREIAEDAKLEPVEDWAFANTGSIYFQKSDGFDNKFRVVLDFQTGYFTGAVVYDGEDVVNGSAYKNNARQHDRSWMAYYNKNGDVQRALDIIKREAMKR
jgi:hypothetical protein